MPMKTTLRGMPGIFFVRAGENHQDFLSTHETMKMPCPHC